MSNQKNAVQPSVTVDTSEFRRILGLYRLEWNDENPDMLVEHIDAWQRSVTAKAVAEKDAEIAQLRGRVAELDTQLGQRPCRHHRCAEYVALAAQAQAPVAAMPEGWHVTCIDDEDCRTYLGIASPTGASAALSCITKTSVGKTIASQVAHQFKHAFAAHSQQQGAEPVVQQNSADNKVVCEHLGALLLTKAERKKYFPDAALQQHAQAAQTKCFTCSGHGLIGGLMPGDQGYHLEDCPDCNGRGFVHGEVEYHGDGYLQPPDPPTQSKCEVCDGTGKVNPAEAIVPAPAQPIAGEQPHNSPNSTINPPNSDVAGELPMQDPMDYIDSDFLFSLADTQADETLESGQRIIDRGGILQIAVDVLRRYGPAIGHQCRAAALKLAEKACEEIAQDHRDQYKGRGKHAPNNPRRADPHADGCSDGANECAAAIGALNKAEG